MILAAAETLSNRTSLELLDFALPFIGATVVSIIGLLVWTNWRDHVREHDEVKQTVSRHGERLVRVEVIVEEVSGKHQRLP